MPDTKGQPYRYLYFFAMLYLTLMLSVAVLSNKIIVIAHHITMAGTLFIPFWFVLSDIITEIYGYKVARKIIWMSFVCHLVFSMLCEIALHINSPNFLNAQQAYNLVLGHLMRVTFSGFIAYIISGTINIYLLAKWKILVQGKYFWLRSIGASTIGELIYTVLAVVMIQLYVLTTAQIIQIIITSYMIKIIASLISAFPANMVVFLLNRIEIVPDKERELDPFRKVMVI